MGGKKDGIKSVLGRDRPDRWTMQIRHIDVLSNKAGLQACGKQLLSKHTNHDIAKQLEITQKMSKLRLIEVWLEDEFVIIKYASRMAQYTLAFILCNRRQWGIKSNTGHTATTTLPLKNGYWQEILHCVFNWAYACHHGPTVKLQITKKNKKLFFRCLMLWARFTWYSCPVMPLTHY